MVPGVQIPFHSLNRSLLSVLYTIYFFGCLCLSEMVMIQRCIFRFSILNMLCSKKAIFPRNCLLRISPTYVRCTRSILPLLYRTSMHILYVLQALRWGILHPFFLSEMPAKFKRDASRIFGNCALIARTPFPVDAARKDLSVNVHICPIVGRVILVGLCEWGVFHFASFALAWKVL